MSGERCETCGIAIQPDGDFAPYCGPECVGVASPPPAVTGEAMTDERLAEIRGLMGTAVFSGDTPRRAMWGLLDEVARLRASGTDERLREAARYETLKRLLYERVDSVEEMRTCAPATFDALVDRFTDDFARASLPRARGTAMTTPETRCEWCEKPSAGHEFCSLACKREARIHRPAPSSTGEADSGVAPFACCGGVLVHALDCGGRPGAAAGAIDTNSVQWRIMHDPMWAKVYAYCRQELDEQYREVDRLRDSPVSADVALREAAEKARTLCNMAVYLADKKGSQDCVIAVALVSEVETALRAALSRVPSSVAASGGTDNG